MIFLFSSVSPVLFIMYLIYRHDLAKEPLKMLVKSFLGGLFAAALAIAIALKLDLYTGSMPPAAIKSFYMAFFTAAIPEEFAKWLVFIWLIHHAKDFDQYFDGILYAIFISMGFALIENIFYVWEGGLGVAFGRAIFTVPGHMLFAVPMGYYLSLSKFEVGKSVGYHKLLSIVVPILLHGTYDFILMYATAKVEFAPLLSLGLLLGFVCFNIWMWRLGLRNISLHREKDRV